MKRFYILLISFLYFFSNDTLKAQCVGDLITNGSFETIGSCPTTFYPGDGTSAGDYLCSSFGGAQCIPWRQLTGGSVDIRNTCYDPWGEIALNPPHCGDGYGSFYPYTYVASLPGQQYSEYMYQQFTTPMVAGASYKISFWYRTRSFNDSLAQDIDVHISNTPIAIPSPTYNGVLTSVTPTFHFHSAPPPSSGWSNWVLVSFVYTATGGEEYISFGHFGPVTFPITFAAYIHLDDISVMPYYSTPTQILTSNASCGFCNGSAWLNHVLGNITWFDATNTLIGSGVDTLHNLCPGTYTAKFQCNCVDSVIGTFTIGNDTIGIFPTNASICENDFYTLPNGNQVSSSGIYFDTLISSAGCDSVIITTLNVLQESSSSIQETICEGQPYTLPNGVVVTQGGIYDIILPNSVGCDSSIHIDLTAQTVPNLSLPNDTSICGGSFVVLDANPDLHNGGTFSWNTGANTASITVNTSGLYIATATYQPCPEQKDSVNVVVENCACEVFIPNAFSPNGDKLNDDFKPQFICDPMPAGYQFFVFNRWGEKVFSTNDISQGWNGYYKNSLQEVGTYFYLISYTNPFETNSTIKKGDITLLH